MIACSVVSPITDRAITPDIEPLNTPPGSKIELNLAVVNLSESYVYERLVYTGWKTNGKLNQAYHRCHIGESVTSFLKEVIPLYFKQASFYPSATDQKELMDRHDAVLQVRINSVDTSEILECGSEFKNTYKPCCGISNIELSIELKDKMGEIIFETSERASKEGVIYSSAKYCKNAKVYLNDMRKYDELLADSCSTIFKTVLEQMVDSTDLQAYTRFVTTSKSQQ